MRSGQALAAGYKTAWGVWKIKQWERSEEHWEAAGGRPLTSQGYFEGPFRLYLSKMPFISFAKSLSTLFWKMKWKW